MTTLGAVTDLDVLSALDAVADVDGWATTREIAEQMSLGPIGGRQSVLVALGTKLGYLRDDELVEVGPGRVGNRTLWGLTTEGAEELLETEPLPDHPEAS